MDSIFNSKIGGIPGLIKSFFFPFVCVHVCLKNKKKVLILLGIKFKNSNQMTCLNIQDSDNRNKITV